MEPCFDCCCFCEADYCACEVDNPCAECEDVCQGSQPW